MISSSLQANSAPTVRWRICRNIFLTLISLQMVILGYIGFAAPSVTDHFFHDFLQQFATEEPQDEQKATVEKQQLPPLVRKTNTVKKKQTISEKEVAAMMIGPYDIPGAFFSNFELERLQPSFRNKRATASQWKELEEKFGAKSCFDDSDGILLQRDTCRLPLESSVNEIVVYNSLSFNRTWCGRNVPAQSHISVRELCKDDTTRLLGDDVTDETIFFRINSPAPIAPVKDCDVACSVTMDTCGGNKQGPECLPDRSEWKVEGRDWKFTYYQHAPGLKVDRKAYKSFQFSASHSFVAEIPLSQFSWDQHGELSPGIDFDTAEKGISFLKTETCHGLIRAEQWAKVMQEKVPLASYCKCAQNTEVPKGMSLNSLQDRQALLKKHLFTLVVEPSIENDYVSGLVWEALQAGAIPVVYGANNILEHVPKNSVINAADIGTKQGTADLLKNITENKPLWESYHAWRTTEGYPESFKRKYGFLRTEPYCRMCRWAHAKKHGFGWNHAKQVIEGPEILRKPCLDDNGLLSGPYRESWLSSSGPLQSATPKACQSFPLASSTKVLEMNNFRVERTWVTHDGIIDMAIPDAHSHDGELKLRLEVPIRNWDGAQFSNVHQLISSQQTWMMSSIAIQDRSSRVTLLANWQTTIASPTNGTIEVTILGQNEDSLHDEETRRIRLIVEDMDMRDVLTEFSISAFADMFIRDFLNPLVLLYKDS